MTEPKPRLAIIEDNQDLCEELVFFLEARGYPVWSVPSAEAFWRQLHGHPAEIVLIDLGLPGEDGLGVLDYLRGLGGYGLIVLTARGGPQDKLRGLSLGADLYRVKPVNFSQLADDIDALWQRLRTHPDSSAAGRAELPATSVPPAWHLDPVNTSLRCPDDVTVRLTPQEYALLDTLLHHQGEMQTKAAVHDALFGQGEDADPHRIDVILSRLRQKAAQQGVRLPVRTVFGRGIVFVR